MFTAADFQARIRAVPFVPFRLTTSAGETFDVLHPEFIMVFRRFLEIGGADPDDGVPDRAHRVSMLHITSVTDLPVAARPPGPHPG